MNPGLLPLLHPLSATLPYALGVDLGTSGLRLALVDDEGLLEAERSAPYTAAFENPEAWLQGLIGLCGSLSVKQRAGIGAIAIDGTSGTLLLCRPDGRPGEGPLGTALPYHQACPEQAEEAASICGAVGPASSASGSLARALRLLREAEASGACGPWLLRHQADWLMGWLLADWRHGEEGNNARLGWDPELGQWQGTIATQPWSASLPEIVPSGTTLGRIGEKVAERLGIASGCLVVAGSTDASAGVLAVQPGIGDGVAVLGSTLVLKQFSATPIRGPGISCHRVAGRWLIGGASNAGAAILGRFFSDRQIRELSRQIDPRRPTGLHLRPMSRTGERFPVDDPLLLPVLEARPISDALYLQALLEGLTAIEVAGWRRLRELGAPPLRRVITLGGGARNPQWRSLRQRALGVSVLNRPHASAAVGMARLAAAARAAAAPTA